MGVGWFDPFRDWSLVESKFRARRSGCKRFRSLPTCAKQAVGPGWVDFSQRADMPRHRLVFCLFLGLWCLLAGFIAATKSCFIDEVIHLPAGLSYWKYNDFRMNPEHPNLLKYAASAPLYFFDSPPIDVVFPDGRELRPWFMGNQGEWGYYTLFMHDTKATQRWMLIGRLVPILIGAAGAVVAWKWGRVLGGTMLSGGLAAFFLLSYPEYLGHAIYVTMDVPQTVSMGVVSLLAWRWWESPSRARTIAFVVGAAVLTQVKLPLTATVILTLLLMIAMSCLRKNSERGTRLRSVLLLSFVMGAAVWCACWAFDGFRFSYHAGKEGAEAPSEHLPPIQIELPSARQQFVNALWKWKVVPEVTLATIAHLDALEHRRSFLLGESREGGFWSYFFITFLVKSTPAMLVATVLVLGLGAWRFRRGVPEAFLDGRLAILVAPTIVMFALLVQSRVNIGHRHMLFVYLPLCVLLGWGVAKLVERGGAARAAGMALVVAQGLSAVVSFPDGATYFNFVGGTPYHARRFVRDSNTDCGQDLPKLRAWCERNGVTDLNLATLGIIRPEAFGISKYRWIIASDPRLFQYRESDLPDAKLPSAISVNHLDEMRFQYPELYDREPDVELNSIVVFLPDGKS